jgi:hypothetical protein
MSSLATLVKTGAIPKGLTATDSGSGIASGKPVILETAGTVTQVVRTSAEIPFSSGDPVEFNNDASTNGVSAAFDSNSNKVVITYSNYYRPNSGDSGGYCIVGTVSGTSISFGTAVVFSTNAVGHGTSVCFDSTNNKVVIAYRDTDDSNKGKVIAGTVSGTSISFGSAVQFESGATTEVNVAFGNGRVLISYIDAGDSTNVKALLATLSGTTITLHQYVQLSNNSANDPKVVYIGNDKFLMAARELNTSTNYGSAVVISMNTSNNTITWGTPVDFESSSILTAGNPRGPGISYDPTSEKAVISFCKNTADSSKGYALVATVSGTTPSFGTAVKFNDNGTTGTLANVYDPDIDKHIIVYTDREVTNDPGTAIEATVSGTSLSFGTAVAFQSTLGPTWLAITYDTSNNKSVVASNVNTGRGNASVLTTGEAEVNNLTAAKFLGIADEAIASSGSGSIIVKGGIATNLTGLTIGSNYYAQGDGTFATSAGTPSVKIGKAISTTSLLLN